MHTYKLEDLFDLKMGKTPSRDNQAYWNDGKHKWISIADLTKAGKYISETKETISDSAVSESGISLIPKDTVVMSFKLSIGKTSITSEPMYSNEAIMAFLNKKTTDLLPEYIYYMFSHKDWNDGTNKAVMGKTLNKATLSKIKINIHDLNQQKVIVQHLDKLSEIITHKQEQLVLLDQLVKSQFVQMFGDMLHNEKGWTVSTLGNVCDVRDGTHDSPKYQTEGYPLVTSKNVTSGVLNFTGCSLISESDFQKINERSKVDIGDILMPMIGTVGNPVIVDTSEPFAIKNVALIKFKNESTVLASFIKSLLESDYFDKAVLSKVRGGTQKFIALGDIRKLTIAIPPMKVQIRFEEILQQVDKYLRKLKSHVSIEKSAAALC